MIQLSPTLVVVTGIARSALWGVGAPTGSGCVETAPVIVGPFWRSADLRGVFDPCLAASVRWCCPGPVGHLAVVAPCAGGRTVFADQFTPSVQPAEGYTEAPAGVHRDDGQNQHISCSGIIGGEQAATELDWSRGEEVLRRVGKLVAAVAVALVTTVTVTQPAVAVAGSDTLRRGETLGVDQSLWSANGEY